MSYLIKYQFNPKLEDGGYNKEDLQSETIQVGKLFEEVNLEILAGKVFSLLAKRNVFVVNLEIFEIVQKPVFFKENSDGISIGKKKFKFDDGAKVLGEEDDSEEGNQGATTGTDIQVYASKEGQSQDLQTLLANPQVINLLTAALAKANGGNIQPHQLNAKSQRATAAPATLQTGEKILRHEFYSPEDEAFVHSVKSSHPNSKFTIGKQYPIISEKLRPIAKSQDGSAAMGISYETVDDNGTRLVVPNQLFVPSMPKLIGDDEPDALTGKLPPKKNSDGLYWGGAGQDDMPDIRRR